MKEFTQHIRLIPVVTTSTGTFEEGSFDIMSDRPFSFEPVPSVDDGGTSWNCDKTLTVDTPDASTVKYFRCERSCIVVVFDSQGNSHRIGDTLAPARAVISPNLNSATLQIKAEMMRNPFAG